MKWPGVGTDVVNKLTGSKVAEIVKIAFFFNVYAYTLNGEIKCVFQTRKQENVESHLDFRFGKTWVQVMK